MKVKQNHRLEVMFLFAVVVIGVVSPFAFGSAPDVSSSSRTKEIHHSIQQLNTLHPLFKKQYLRPPKTATAESTASLQRELSKKSRIRRLISNLKVTSGRKDGSWKGGESKATIPSRLFFSYVSPLLELAAKRTLTEDDAFFVAESCKMDKSVDSLANVYARVRRNAHKKADEQRMQCVDRVRKSESILLLKALVEQQRGTLLLTGFLRLVNTAVQAFPAILVSRLLRCIEGGNSIPASRALSAAIMLVAVLSLKMLLENQFFHGVVGMSTKTRGSLEGLIFDKSLRLPDGGSGVMTKQRSNDEKKALGSGGVLNLMQTDATIIESAAMQIHTIWDGPLQVRKCYQIPVPVPSETSDSMYRLLCIRICCTNTLVRVYSTVFLFS